jgi:ribosomal protein L11 methyltransferase
MGGDLIEIAVSVDAEAAEAVSELFNRYNGGGYEEDSQAGEAGGGGAVMEATGFDDFGNPAEGEYRLVVKTYIKPGLRGDGIRRQIEEGLWHLRQIHPFPEPRISAVREEDWAHAWKKHYKPLRVGKRVVLRPSWEDYPAQPDDLVVVLDPGMAFGTGLHPSTRLCIAALEEIVQPGEALLDVGTGSGVLSIVGARLGATPILATDIDSIAVEVACNNARANGLDVGPATSFVVNQGSVPDGKQGFFPVVVSNILAEVLAGLFDGAYGNVPLAEPLASGGKMILAGILAEKTDLVIQAAGRHGLTVVNCKQEDDWVALILSASSPL